MRLGAVSRLYYSHCIESVVYQSNTVDSIQFLFLVDHDGEKESEVTAVGSITRAVRSRLPNCHHGG